MAHKLLTTLGFMIAVLILAVELFVLVTAVRADTSSAGGVNISWTAFPRQVNSTLNNDCTDILLSAYNENPTTVQVTMRIELDPVRGGPRVMSRLLQGTINGNAIADWSLTAVPGIVGPLCGYDASSYQVAITVLDVAPATKTSRLQLFRDDWQ